MLMQKIDKKGQIGRKVVKDVLAIQQMLGISDKDLARMADGEISQFTLAWWRWKLKRREPNVPEIFIYCSGLGCDGAQGEDRNR